jgi:hypothetical protein
LSDARTTFPQCLEAVLIAELVDCDAWARLAELATGFHQSEMAEQFRMAMIDDEHRTFIRSVLEEELKAEAGTT